MELDSLRTASTYINNLLLARGLLRNGQSIDFARPDKAEEGLESTMGKVMSIINDLVLRRDRDAEQRETLAQSMRTLKADGIRHATDFERLQTKHAEAQRRLGLAEATERALKLQLRTAEQAAKGLKEEMGRMKILVNQTRAQCANEVRKRERVIEGLKKHVGEGGRARGSGKAVGVAVINVVAGVGGDEGLSKAVAVDESGYDLRMETNEFLTELARGLSEENENLGGLVRRTIDTLATISSWEGLCQQEGGMVRQHETNYESMAADMEGIIEHLRTLLTNPSFVPLEEVEMREDEIIRLRQGWEKMEGRWREAVQMMDGWRKRMARSGQTVNLEELQMGLSLSPVRVPGVEQDLSDNLPTYEEEMGEGDTQADIDAMDDSQIAFASRADEEADEGSDGNESDDDVTPEEEEMEPQHADQSYNTQSSVSPGPPPQLSPLKESDINGTRRGNFTTIVEENTWDLAHLDHSSSNIENTMPPEDEVDLLSTSHARPETPGKSTSSLKLTAASRIPRPPPAMPQQSPLTMASIAAKLAATEREADAARVRAKLKAAKLSSASAAATTTIALKPPAGMTDMREPVKEDAPMETSRKRKSMGKHGGRASRRRSTLSPWELESLISGAGPATPSR
jgi:hypothetical protein